jgi:hypothetical protein
MNHIAFASIGVGLGLGALAGYALARRVVSLLGEYTRRAALVRGFAIAAGLIAAFPLTFLAFVVGGNVGGGLGASLLPGPAGMILGLALGIAAVVAVGLLLSCSIGALVGCGVGLVLSHGHET